MLKSIFAIIALVLIAIFPSKVLFTESDTNLRLLAIGIILSIALGGFGMLRFLLSPSRYTSRLDRVRYSRLFHELYMVSKELPIWLIKRDIYFKEVVFFLDIIEPMWKR